jgi:hypothetical protein
MQVREKYSCDINRIYSRAHHTSRDAPSGIEQQPLLAGKDQCTNADPLGAERGPALSAEENDSNVRRRL